MRSRRGDNTRPVDLGWLFLLPGIALIACAVLIAAEDDVYEARFHRDQAVAIERRHAERVDRYRAYVEALEARDPTVVRSLVTSQLNAAPTDLVEERIAGVPVYDSTEVFSALEPPPATPAQRVRVDSVLARWATADGSRVWLLASGALCVFVGLLPPVNRRGGAVVEAPVPGDAGEADAGEDQAWNEEEDPTPEAGDEQDIQTQAGLADEDEDEDVVDIEDDVDSEEAVDSENTVETEDDVEEDSAFEGEDGEHVEDEADQESEGDADGPDAEVVAEDENEDGDVEDADGGGEDEVEGWEAEGTETPDVPATGGSDQAESQPSLFHDRR